MSDAGSSVTLIFYRMSDRWWTEPVLNLLAAACQMSTLTHVEIALGEAAGSNNTMTNVCRIFNDRMGAVRNARSAIRALPPHPQLRGFFCHRAGARRAHRKKPAVRVHPAGVLRARRAADAAVRQELRRAAVFADGDGALHPVASTDGFEKLLLCGCVRSP